MEMTRVGKSALIAAGAGFGLLRGLRALGNINQNAARLGTIQARIDTIHVAVARLAEQSEQLQAELHERVTRAQLSDTINRVFRQLEDDVDARFQQQSRSVEALQTMVGQTDVLLQKVLDGLESMKSEGERAPRQEQGDNTTFAGLGQKWNLTPASGSTSPA
jgi:chromosome segregation ATPase